MTTSNKNFSPIIPTLRYRDAKKAIAWLCNAFGFETHACYESPTGEVMHAELKFGTGVIMIGQVADTPFAKFMKHPDEIDNKRNTHCCYVVVADPDAHYERAKSAGAKILMELTTKDYGGRDYTCADPEGYVWSFGSYAPQ